MFGSLFQSVATLLKLDGRAIALSMVALIVGLASWVTQGDWFKIHLFSTPLIFICAGARLFAGPRMGLSKRSSNWTRDSIAEERDLVLAAAALYVMACIATLLGLFAWFRITPSNLVEIAAIVLAVGAIATGISWIRAREAW